MSYYIAYFTAILYGAPGRGPRMGASDRRLQVEWRSDAQGNLLIGYTLKSSGWHRGYFKYMVETQLESPFTGCELAIIANDCSVAWVRFTIGELVPNIAAKAGYIIGHGPIVVSRFKHLTKLTYRFGYYMAGSPFFNYMEDDINTFDIMVAVWLNKGRFGTIGSP